MNLDDLQCIVALDEREIGWIIARSQHIQDTDFLQEYSTDDNGFNPEWFKGLEVGVYKLTLRPRIQSFFDFYDEVIDVTNVETLWLK